MENKVLEASKKFWTAMESADELGMRAIADENCNFVHIGITCKLDDEIKFYTSGTFKPTEIKFNNQKVDIFNETAVVITDCVYSLLLDGKETSHHFAVTEVYHHYEANWKLVTFTFTALVY